MPAPPPAPAQGPARPPVDPGPSTAIPGIWVPAFIFAHVFAGYWLYRAMRLMRPGGCQWPWARLLARLRADGSGGGGRARRDGGSGGECGGDGECDGAVAGVARASSLDSRVLAELEDAAMDEAPRSGACAGMSEGRFRTRGRGAQTIASPLQLLFAAYTQAYKPRTQITHNKKPK